MFPELSYGIVGAAFTVFNEIGYGFPEKVYQTALAKEFQNRKISYEREVHVPLRYREAPIARYFADFIIEERVIVELKVVPKLTYSNAKQLLTYLRGSGMKLGILIYFTRDGVKYRRVLNSGASA